MPITSSKESIFNEKNVQTIVNTINCIGIMGAGIALECKLRYPDMYEDYRRRIRNKEVNTGRPYLYRRDDIWILNFPTKFHWKDDSKLEWIEEGLKYFRDHYKEWGIKSIAFPRLGSDRGGLNWKDVKKLMFKYLKDIDIPVRICLDSYREPKGLERDMTGYLNNLNADHLKKIGINKSIIPKILSNLPTTRFRELRSVKGVGRISYEKVYKDIYDHIVDKNKLYPKLLGNAKLTRKWQDSTDKEYSNMVTHLKSDLKSELENLREDMYKYQEINKTLKDISSRIHNASLLLAKNYLKKTHSDIMDWIIQKNEKKGFDLEGRIDSKSILVCEVKTTKLLKKKDFNAKLKREFTGVFKRLDSTSAQYKYLFLIDNSIFDLICKKYSRKFPSIKIINIFESQKKLTHLNE